MSTKSVKITNGKILNYKISASGYKTIYGSKLISANTSITHNMISESDPNGVYSFGDRIGNCATFVNYFNSKDPETNIEKTYAVFVLDAKYRTAYCYWSTVANDVLPSYNNSSSAFAALESATYNNNKINANFSAAQVPAFAAASAVTLTNLGITSVLPNLKELQLILSDATIRANIDSLDPTVSDYSSLQLTSLSGFGQSYGNGKIWSSTQFASDSAWFYSPNSTNGAGKNNPSYMPGVIPIFEIPVN